MSKLFILLLLIFLFLSFLGIRSYGVSDPQTSLTISPSSIKGDNDWYITSLELTLTATGSAKIRDITYWLDDNEPLVMESSSLTRVFNEQGEHNLHYFATDVNGQEEWPVNEFVFKIDSVSPTPWYSFIQDEKQNDHTFRLSVTVDEATAGFDVSEVFYQYAVTNDETYGYYENLLNCSSNWVDAGWLRAQAAPETDGAKTIKLTTEVIDFCNSDFGSCEKRVKFRAIDLAGNESTSEFCLNGAWLKTTGGDVHAEAGYNFKVGAPEAMGEYLVSSGTNSTDNFSSKNGWYLISNSQKEISLSYDDWYGKLNYPGVSLPDGKLPTVSGVYYVDGDLSIDNNTIPTNYNQKENIGAVIFVKHNLNVEEDLITSPSTNLIFIVKNEIKIKKKIRELSGFFLVDGKIDIGYDGKGEEPFTLYGSFVSDKEFRFGKALKGKKNLTEPAEILTYQPQYLLNKDLIRLLSTKEEYFWTEVSP